MNAKLRTAVLAAVAVAAAGIVLAKGRPGAAPGSSAPALSPPAGVPRLVDLGAGKCIPCKAMAPILAELRETYSGRLDVVFIDVWENADAAGPYAIGIIPTQIFYAADGRELSRHEGFMSREEILARWKSHGVALD